MIEKKLKLSMPYECKDGITRYVIMMIKLGLGYCVVWDIVPTSVNYWADMEAMRAREKAGLRGSIGQAKFLKMLMPTTPNKGE